MRINNNEIKVISSNLACKTRRGIVSRDEMNSVKGEEILLFYRPFRETWTFAMEQTTIPNRLFKYMYLPW